MKKIAFLNKKRIFILSLLFFIAVSGSNLFALSTNTSKESTKQYAELVSRILEFIQKSYVDEVDPEVLYRGALKGMLSELNDPYTTYLDKTVSRSVNDTTSGQFGGVGLIISKPVESTADKPAYVEVSYPVEDSPGFKAGIVAGDLIISINGVDSSTITMEEVLDKLRGKVGEKVNLVIRRGKAAEFPVTLTRAMIEVPTVKYGMINKIGYAKILEFTPLTAERVQQALDHFKSEKAESIIIDLRNNPGGLISSVVEVADKFIDNGPIVSTKSRLTYENSVFNATTRKTVVRNIPIVVLINRGSASASEILSGALKDNHLAYLVGDRTYGKGSVQQVMPLSATEGIKYTVARYYTPSDVNIDKVGIPPDREILFPALSEQGEKQFAEIFKSNEIEKYVEAHPEMTEKDIAQYGKVLKSKYPEVDESSLRKIIRNEVNKLKPTMLYDLEYDIQLVEAVKILTTENFAELVAQTKTLKQLQDEVVLDDKKSEKKENK